MQGTSKEVILIKKKTMSILILTTLLSLVGCNNQSIDLPDKSQLENITLSKSIEEKMEPTRVSSNIEIEKIIDSIKSNSKKINTGSHNDEPTNIDDYIKLEFIHSDDGTSRAYAYKVKDLYYFEQPYVGIWKITKSSYENIDALLQD